LHEKSCEITLFTPVGIVKCDSTLYFCW